MDELNVALLQLDLKWQDSQENLRKITEIFEKIGNVDVIFLPEMFTTGFSMNPQSCYENMDGETILWLKENARKIGALIVGSLIIKENGVFYNRLVCAFPDGTAKTYDKRHLFRMGNEDKFYKNGDNLLVVSYKDWNICPLICYDLRFPVWSRNNNKQYDLLVYIANWPEKRREHWVKLLYARAIENQSYVVGVNRVGHDDNGIDYYGDSMVVDPKGDLINCIESKKEGIVTAKLSKSKLVEYRDEFPVHLDADRFKLIQ